jgi:hypothetical protein
MPIPYAHVWWNGQCQVLFSEDEDGDPTRRIIPDTVVQYLNGLAHPGIKRINTDPTSTYNPDGEESDAPDPQTRWHTNQWLLVTLPLMQNPQNLKLNLLGSLLVDLVSSLLNQQNLPQVKLSFALLLYLQRGKLR